MLLINHDSNFFLSKLTHLFFGKKVAYRQLFQDGRAPGVFPMRKRHLWDGACVPNGNGAVRLEVAMELEVATMAITEDNKHDRIWQRMNQGGAGTTILSEGAAAGVLQRGLIKREFVL